MENKHQSTHILYLFFTLSLIPFILMLIYIDDGSPTELTLFLSSVIDDNMLSESGMHSSSIPIFSKIIINYNTFFVPIISVAMYLVT